MTHHHTFRRRSDSGFTFIEVMVALMLLAASAGILIGLQGAAVRRTIRDGNAQQAMLAARRIMSAIELLGHGELEIPTADNQPIVSLLQDLDLPAPSNSNEAAALQALTGTILVEDWILPVPGTEESPLKRITLRIAWGPQPDEAVNILYLMPLQNQPRR